MRLTQFSLIYLLFLCNLYAAIGGCNQGGQKLCCYGFFWDETSKECKECPVGYTGMNCSIQCRYPSYGKSCQNVCNCTKEYCDTSTGCREEKVPDETTSPTKITNTITTVSPNPLPEETTYRIKRMRTEEKTTEQSESNAELQSTPILIGAVVALCLILLAVAVKFILKNMKNSYLKNRGENNHKTNLQAELKRKTCEYEDLKENLYEELDEKESDDTSDKKRKESKPENDYIDTLNFTKKENRGDDRESKHFYDALK